ncbi:Ribonuclease HII [Aquicella siphonis]|uniref:Ribonuclease HII n=1 Tax=Aquicella siphonis TaxID=254247 RepID=A0A5E4PIG4_9COXI|nr:ribonuclease HII [Aquicella siphonis]VVC76227.1 Ribonuclease HII [Aquicella siphonis]
MQGLSKPITDNSFRTRLIAGVDEAGRGPLAGPVIAAAVILDPACPIAGLADSKKLSPLRRQQLFQQIREQALAWSVARASVAEIDTFNILQASLLAMQRAVHKLSMRPEMALIDGNRCPRLSCPVQAIIRGDESEPAISAASIVAKVLRDRLMLLLDKRYPQYGFAAHKGYPTAAHIQALHCHGPSRAHRRSFAPVAECIVNGVRR